MVGAEGGVRLEQTVEVVVDGTVDTWVAAVAHGDESLFPFVPYNRSVPGELDAATLAAGEVDDPATAFGFANPVFLDANGDGEIDPSFEVVDSDWTHYRREDRLSPY